MTIVFCDNSTINNSQFVSNIPRYNFEFKYVKNSNIGYFPAFYKGLKFVKFENKNFDYVIVSNVDLTLDKSFFKSLSILKINSDVGVIAPSIISVEHGRNSNPKILNRPSLWKLKFLRFLFSSVIGYYIYNKLSAFKSRYKRPNTNKYIYDNLYTNRSMYAPHGAFIIFTKNYIKSNARLHYPIFLFGEEVFVGEESRLNKLDVIYEPSLIIHDLEHGSTSLEKHKFICAEHVKSYTYLLKNYFE